jgi:5-(carboxyamino)imidazole ribonucleotide synthase
MTPLPKGSVIGILGGGQLARMTAEAAQRLGYHAHIYAQEADEPACQVTDRTTLADFHDQEALQSFADQVDVITLEWENIPVPTLEFLQQTRPVYPAPTVLEVTQDRVLEKSFAARHGLGVPEFRAVASLGELRQAVTDIGLPAILKTARMGYDGKGQFVLRAEADIETAWRTLNTHHTILEKMVPFEKEISVIIARGQDGRMAAYPAVENRHKNGILDETDAPAEIPSAIADAALHMAETLAEKLQVVGLLAVEMFVVKGRVLMNEMAPRPHNSGHWSMDFAATSQFEQLVRAVCGLPFGLTDILSPSHMKNLIGDDVNDLAPYQGQPDTHIHLYGKKESRPGRKMGHVNRKRSD